MSTAMFDLAGPRARARYRVYGVVGTIVIVAVFAFVVYRFAQTGQFSGKKWSILQYTQVQESLLTGLLNTLKAAAMAAVLALGLGALLAVGRVSEHAYLRAPAFAFTELFRAIPLILLMFTFYYAGPSLGLSLSTYWSVVLALTLYNGTVLAETFRAGIAAVPKGQTEAAKALGMRKTRMMVSVIFPQALRTMLPNVISQLVVLTKDTALGFVITYDELLYAAKLLATDPKFDRPLIPMTLVAAAGYISTCLLLTALAHWVDRRMGRSRKAPEKRMPLTNDATAM